VKNQATRHYKNQELMTASPARLVVMLYDRAIYSLNDAIKAIEAGDIERRWKSNKNANEVITHLAMTLDFEKGGQIAQNLNDLYRFMLRTLVNVDVRNDPQPARDAIRLLEPLRQSWDQIAKGSDNAATAPSAVAAIDNHGETPPPAGIAISA
jgi:flagellar protein FliS